MTVDAGNALIQALDAHNPWWERGKAAIPLPPRRKSDFYHLANPDGSGSLFEANPVLGIVGRRGVGKTTLVRQFVHHRIDSGDDPEQFLYLPFDADPLYQLKSDEQFRSAVRYYESRVLGQLDGEQPHFVLLDDVHRIEHPNKPTIDGWGVVVSELLEDAPGRHVAVVASAEVQVDRELEGAGVPDEDYYVQVVLPEKFRDHLFTLYPDLEEGDDRVSPTSLREGDNSLPAALRSGDVGPLVEEFRAKLDQVADVERRIQSQVADYLVMGGTISYARDRAVESAADPKPDDYRNLREDVREALYQEVPGFESIQTIADLERLCALAARNRAVEPFRYQELVDLFDVDRRTIAGSYLSALDRLYLLKGATEYDNSRPRSVKLYLRDTGLVTALADVGVTAGDAVAAVRNDFDREVDLARIAAFDHTMRFSYTTNEVQGNDEPPSVQFWRGREGEVDFVFEVGGTPVPVGFAYRSQERDRVYAAVREFLDEFGVPVGFLLAGDTVRGNRPVEDLGDGVVRLPYWLYLLLC